MSWFLGTLFCIAQPICDNFAGEVNLGGGGGGRGRSLWTVLMSSGLMLGWGGRAVDGGCTKKVPDSCTQLWFPIPSEKGIL